MELSEAERIVRKEARDEKLVALSVVLAEYDRRAEHAGKVTDAVRKVFGPHAGPSTYDDAEAELFALLGLDHAEVMGHAATDRPAGGA